MTQFDPCLLSGEQKDLTVPRLSGHDCTQLKQIYIRMSSDKIGLLFSETQEGDYILSLVKSICDLLFLCGPSVDRQQHLPKTSSGTNNQPMNSVQNHWVLEMVEIGVEVGVTEWWVVVGNFAMRCPSLPVQENSSGNYERKTADKTIRYSRGIKEALHEKKQ